MLSLLFISGVQAALRTDFANVYYCPKGYCLDEKEQAPGFAGPQVNFVQCKMGEESVKPKVYNYYLDERKEVEGKMWSLEENLKDIPKMVDRAMPAKCCEGYDESKQCKVMNSMSTDKKVEMGCCFDMGFGAMMKPCCHGPHEVMDGKDMVGFSQCPVEERKMGGKTMFEKGTTCDDLEANEWNHGRSCCEAVTADCEACKYGVSTQSYCKKFPKMDGCDQKVCCEAMTADCLACKKGVSVMEFCKGKPETEGCDEPKMCCKAMKASCLACTEGVTVDEYCKENPKTMGCGDEPKACCLAMTAQCLSCKRDMTVEEFCKKAPKTVGCEDVNVTVDMCSAGDEGKKACKKLTKSLKKQKKIAKSDKCSYIKKQKKCMMVNQENCSKMEGKKACKKFKGCVFADNKCGK